MSSLVTIGVHSDGWTSGKRYFRLDVRVRFSRVRVSRVKGCRHVLVLRCEPHKEIEIPKTKTGS